MRLPDHQPQARDAVVAVPEQIVQHARTVAGLSDRVGQAWHAATVVGLDVAAYGQMCAFLPRALAPLHERIGHTVRQVGEAMEHTSTALDTAAATYTGVDENAAARLRQVGGQVS